MLCDAAVRPAANTSHKDDMGGHAGESIAAEVEKPIGQCDFFDQFFQNFPNASECIRTHPGASERIRKHPNRSGQVPASPKTSKRLKNLAKTRENFAKISQKFSRRLLGKNIFNFGNTCIIH